MVRRSAHSGTSSNSKAVKKKKLPLASPRRKVLRVQDTPVSFQQKLRGKALVVPPAQRSLRVATAGVKPPESGTTKRVIGEEECCHIFQKSQEEAQVDLEDRKMTATKLGYHEGHKKSRGDDSADANNNEEDRAGEEEPGGDVEIIMSMMISTRKKMGDKSPRGDRPSDAENNKEVGSEFEERSDDSTDESEEDSNPYEKKVENSTEEMRRERCIWRRNYYLAIRGRWERREIDDDTYWCYGADCDCSLFDESS